FRDDIERFLRGDVVLAQPDSAAYRTRRFAQRHRLALGAAGVLILILAAGLATTTWQAQVARRQANRAAAVQDFLIGLFDAADPNRTQGRDVTVRELLDRGASNLQSKLAEQPQLRETLDGVLVELYGKLGDEAKALPLAESRRDLALRTEGADSLQYG